MALAEICAKCERYIGTEGGGMDQSISFLAEKGTVRIRDQCHVNQSPFCFEECTRATDDVYFKHVVCQAKLIEFQPLRATDIKLPEGAVFVISNCCVEMNKAASSHYNIRVVECRIATKVPPSGPLALKTP